MKTYRSNYHRVVIITLALMLFACSGTRSYTREAYNTIASIAEVVNATMAALDDLYEQGILSQETADLAKKIHAKYRAAHIAATIALEHYATIPKDSRGRVSIQLQDLLAVIMDLSGELTQILHTELAKP